MTNVLRSLREQKGISQEELASELKISRQTLSKYENEETKFSLDIIKNWPDFLMSITHASSTTKCRRKQPITL